MNNIRIDERMSATTIYLIGLILQHNPYYIELERIIFDIFWFRGLMIGLHS
jgi:hypothetical protein